MIKPSMIIGFLLANIIICIVIIMSLPFGVMHMSFLDIGQGDSIYIRTPDDYMVLVDGGPNSVVIEELSDVLPIYTRTIDMVILTHPHSDHVNGLVEVLKRYQISEVLIVGTPYHNAFYQKFLRLIDENEIDLHFAESSRDIRVGNEVFLDIIWPIQSRVGEYFENVNNASIAMKVIFRDHSFLLTGDAEIEEEKEIIKSGFDINSDVLKAGHHGSKTATSDDFLNRIDPSVVVIQSGIGNSFGHPHKETLEHLLENGIEIRRNDLEGKIDFIY